MPDIAALVPAVRDAGGGLAGLRKLTGERNRHLVWRKGDAATSDLVQRVFDDADVDLAHLLGNEVIVQQVLGGARTVRLCVQPRPVRSRPKTRTL